MKEPAAVAVGVVITFVLTCALWMVFLQGLDEIRQVRLRSDVYEPTRAIIHVIRCDAEEGKADLVVRELLLFEKRWQEFMSGGKLPELFVHEIAKLAEE